MRIVSRMRIVSLLWHFVVTMMLVRGYSMRGYSAARVQVCCAQRVTEIFPVNRPKAV